MARPSGSAQRLARPAVMTAMCVVEMQNEANQKDSGVYARANVEVALRSRVQVVSERRYQEKMKGREREEWKDEREPRHGMVVYSHTLVYGIRVPTTRPFF